MGLFDRPFHYILSLSNIPRYPVVVTPPKATRTCTSPPKSPSHWELPCGFPRSARLPRMLLLRAASLIGPPGFSTRNPTVGAALISHTATGFCHADSHGRRGFPLHPRRLPYRAAATGILHADSHSCSRRADLRFFERGAIAGRVVPSRHNISRHICTPLDLEYILPHFPPLSSSVGSHRNSPRGFPQSARLSSAPDAGFLIR